MSPFGKLAPDPYPDEAMAMEQEGVLGDEIIVGSSNGSISSGKSIMNYPR